MVTAPSTAEEVCSRTCGGAARDDTLVKVKVHTFRVAPSFFGDKLLGLRLGYLISAGCGERVL